MAYLTNMTGQSCRRCYWWKRRDPVAGTCWLKAQDRALEAATVEESDTCDSWQAKVIHVASDAASTPPASTPAC